ncbi:type II and III secretion system protein family protein [Planctomyces sp. SH-PL62]|uniref:type II and III secretion system protein family protein n=1 Tax=Planctomyces sp. SH-PL62 TaxID=1636152 RepID=UPI00078C0FA1|nr:pilus assembly protein N-terminal domain-containing protein [Planctomyces sp. SH-PL62]AMV38184.1 Type II secretion system protein D precursor [Planctomyces sp. SH-PL62]
MKDSRTTSRGTDRGGAFARSLLATALMLSASGLAAQDASPAPPMIPLPPPPRVEAELDAEADSGGLAIPALPDGPTAPVLSGASPSSVIEIKVGQGRFLTFPEDLAQPGKPAPFLAVGDPMVADFFQIGPRQIRLMGKRLGITDLMITAASGRTFEYELRIIPDLPALEAELKRLFPDASLSLSPLRDKVVVEGQARDVSQVSRIVLAIDGYIRNAQRVVIQGQVGNARNAIEEADPDAPESGSPMTPPAATPTPVNDRLGPVGFAGDLGGMAGGMGGGPIAPPSTPGSITANQIATNQTQVVNLIRVPTSQQVLLKVRVAELNRTAFREIGADFLASIPQFGSLFGTQIGGSSFEPGRIGRSTFNPDISKVDPRNIAMGAGSTVFGTFSQARFNVVLSALRRNNLLKILAEPNLVTLNGHQADFLAGGQFPVPINSGLGGGVGGGNVQVQFKDFGVRLAFLPFVEDGETIRLTVDPEVSSIDFSLGTTLVPGGTPVPGLNIRRSHTTVELKQGETLAIAGLMQLTLDGQTQRIPGLGDLPYIGAFFSNTTSNRVEKELVVLVTPYLIEPMRPGQVPPTPGDEIDQPNDLEFFFMNRIEGRTGVDARATTMYDDPLHLVRPALIERKYLSGPVGYSK